MKKNKTKKKKGDGGKKLRELFKPEPWVIKTSALKRGQFTQEFRARLDQRIITTFGTYPSEQARMAKSIVEHAYHVLFGML